MAAWYKLRKDMEAAGVKSIARQLLEQDEHRSRVFAGEASSVLAACRGSIAASSSGSAAASSGRPASKKMPTQRNRQENESVVQAAEAEEDKWMEATPAWEPDEESTASATPPNQAAPAKPTQKKKEARSASPSASSALTQKVPQTLQSKLQHTAGREHMAQRSGNNEGHR